MLAMLDKSSDNDEDLPHSRTIDGNPLIKMNIAWITLQTAAPVMEMLLSQLPESGATVGVVTVDDGSRQRDKS